MVAHRPRGGVGALSPTFTNDEVRRYAVSVLSDAGDDELMGYLQQLVQALRYERQDDSQLARFLVDRAVTNSVLANFLHWYLVVEWEDPTCRPSVGAHASAVRGGVPIDGRERRSSGTRFGDRAS